MSGDKKQPQTKSCISIVKNGVVVAGGTV